MQVKGMLVRILKKTTWLLPILLVGLAVLSLKSPAWTPNQALADDPPTTDEARAEGAQPPAYPALAELAAEAPQPADATAQLDASTQGTY
jgi:hypothetical protein